MLYVSYICACLCSWIFICECGHTCAMGHMWKSEDNLACQPLIFHLTLFGVSCCSLMLGQAGPRASGDSPASATSFCHGRPAVTDTHYQICTYACTASTSSTIPYHFPSPSIHFQMLMFYKFFKIFYMYSVIFENLYFSSSVPICTFSSLISLAITQH